MNRSKLFLLIWGMICFVSIFPAILPAQVNSDDPFEGNYQLVNTAQIVLVHVERESRLVNARLYQADGLVDVEGLSAGPLRTANAPALQDVYPQLDLAAGDFNDDGIEEFFIAYEGNSRNITMLVASVNASDQSWAEAAQASPQPAFPALFDLQDQAENFNIRRVVRVLSGQFDNDPEDEILLAYWAEAPNSNDGPIQLILYDFDNAFQPSVIASIADERMNPRAVSLSSDPARSSKFDVTSGDFDGDGLGEIMLLYVETIPGNNQDWNAFVKIYDIDSGNGALVAKVKSPVPLKPFTPLNEYLNRLVLATGDFNNDGYPEVVASWQLTNNEDSDFYLQVYRITAGLDTVSVIDQPERWTGSTGARGWPMGVVTADLDYDDRDEIVVAGRTNLQVFKVNDDLSIGRAIGFDNFAADDIDIFHRILAVSDMDARDGEPLAREIILTEKTSAGLKMRIYQDSDKSDSLFTGLELVTEVSDSTDEIEILAVAALNPDGIPITLGPPERHSRSEITQPLVILNAPPIHFDIIDDVVYDINECYSGEPCEHRAIYMNATTVESEVTAEVSADWGVSTSLSAEGGINFSGLVSGSVNRTLNRRYGQGFTRVEGAIETYHVTVTSDASDDDRIFATIANYEVLEYPVFAMGELVGHVVAVVPEVQGVSGLQNTWVGGKSGRLRTYPIAHEVGNILSYQAIANLPEGATLFGNGALTDGSGNTWEMSATAGQSWQLAFNSTEIVQRERRAFQQVSRTTGGEISGAYGPFSANLSASVTDEYSSEQISTHRLTVNQESAVSVEFGQIDGAILGTKTYTVSPYVYWAANGALVLDYAVQPDVTPGVASWWEESYGEKPDMALILPWRYDEQKGMGGPNPALQSKETREILFNPSLPEPGEHVSIIVRVHNFSLTDHFGSVTVRFYLGDPDDGGHLIVNDNGISDIQFMQLLARDNVVVSLDNWLVPDDVDAETKVYVDIDPENQVDELHENNNTGWTLLNPELQPATGIRDKESAVPAQFALLQNYPNPFNPETTIRFRLPVESKVRITVYDVLGREVEIVTDESFDAGEHRIRFAAGDLASGVYFYRIAARSRTGRLLYSAIGKMLLLK